MSFKKKLLVVAGVSALTAAMAVPAMALENEFHGLFRSYGWVTNALSGGIGFNLGKDAKTSSYVEQRARLQYIAKANDDLKLVTHFELDSKWGGLSGGKYVTNDAGKLDADAVTLETKNVFLDFKVPATPVNVKLGLQPFADSYLGTFGVFDGTGLVASAKLGAITPTFGWFRVDDTTAGHPTGKKTTDVIVVDGKYAINKDLTVGANYYNVQKDGTVGPGAELLHMVGLNAAAKVGPAAISGFFGYQFGDFNKTQSSKVAAFGAGATAKIKAGPGSVNAAALYLSGDKNGTGTDNDQKGWQELASNGLTSYFNHSNMWLLIRNGNTINSSAAVGGLPLNKGGRGLIGLFGGYDVVAGKVFANANIGAGMAATTAGSEESYIGTELNGQVGYKLYDNLSVSFIAAYLVLGDGVKSTTTAERLPAFAGTANADADNPYLTAIQVSYLF